MMFYLISSYQTSIDSPCLYNPLNPEYRKSGTTPRYMKVGTFDEKLFPSSRAVLGKSFSYKCVPFHV